MEIEFKNNSGLKAQTNGIYVGLYKLKLQQRRTYSKDMCIMMSQGGVMVHLENTC